MKTKLTHSHSQTQGHISHERYRRSKQSHQNDHPPRTMGISFFNRWYRWLVLTCVVFLITGCMHGNAREKHAAQMFANILVTAEAQLAEGAPPLQQSAGAIQTAARAGLKVLDFEIER